MQKILEMSTYKGGVRSEAVGWSCHDGDMIKEVLLRGERRPNSEFFPSDGNIANLPVGAIRSPSYFYSYPTPLHAIGDGWKLLAPPREYMEGETPCMEWWFVKD